MNCRNCKKQIPEDSVFCPFCGKDVIPDDVCPNCRHKLPDGSVFCPFCGSQVENCEDGNKKRDIIQDGFSQNKQPKRIVLPIVSSILGLLVIALSIVSFNLNSDNANLRSQIIKQQTEIDDLNSEIEKTKDSYNALKKTSNEYSSTIKNIKSFSNRSYPGYSSDKFYSTKSIVFMKRNQTLSEAFRVVGKYNTTYYLKASGAIVANWNGSFDSSSQCVISVTAKYKGVETISFTNDLNKEHFDVLVIVE